MTKSLDEIDDDVYKTENISQETVRSLEYYLKNDINPERSLPLAADMGFSYLAPFVFPYLSHPEGEIREQAVYCLLGRLAQDQYGEQGFQMAKEDRVEKVREAALASLGAILDGVPKRIQKEIASYLYQVVTDSQMSNASRECAYYSVALSAYNPSIDYSERDYPRRTYGKNIQDIMEEDVLEQFCEKYHVENL